MRGLASTWPAGQSAALPRLQGLEPSRPRAARSHCCRAPQVTCGRCETARGGRGGPAAGAACSALKYIDMLIYQYINMY
eukprot:6364434-Lingulodinium_polyedra.AAC.1